MKEKEASAAVIVLGTNVSTKIELLVRAIVLQDSPDALEDTIKE